ncbi:hypothetical protein SDC9_201542 [bioreactor metagenome]|uniref:Uncharacterized protein n=1 Tax=bioreactor metagenome TaxID=1076179 RepID=A0A645J051_9ZZZZ
MGPNIHSGRNFLFVFRTFRIPEPFGGRNFVVAGIYDEILRVFLFPADSRIHFRKLFVQKILIGTDPIGVMVAHRGKKRDAVHERSLIFRQFVIRARSLAAIHQVTDTQNEIGIKTCNHPRNGKTFRHSRRGTLH